MKKVRFLYVRNEQKFPVGCVAYVRDKSDEGCDQVIYNFSVYNPNERFDKKTARIWAAGMMATEPKIFTADGDGFHINDLLHDVCLKIECDDRLEHKLPRRFVKALWETREKLAAALLTTMSAKNELQTYTQPTMF